MTSRASRQSFLGRDAERVLRELCVGILGAGGGGSHIAQQLAHVGVRQFVIFDPDVIEESNMNRLVGAVFDDVVARRSKIDIAARLICGVQPNANIVARRCRWQDDAELLRGCDIVFGCLDTLKDRAELEVTCRRFLIPYIDIGLGVKSVINEAPRMAGQVVMSVPGAACFRCLGFITEREIAEEVAQYGDAGPRPQVIWANAILAATAVGLAVDLVTDWTESLRGPAYLAYDGNVGSVLPHPRLKFAPRECVHFGLSDVGEPTFTAL